MEKKSKSKHESNALRAFGLIILPITVAYLVMLVVTIVMDANQSELDPSWIIGLGLEPLKSTFPWSITGVLVAILISFALKRRKRFWFLLTLTSIYAFVMLYLFLTAATYVPSIYY